jgi:murein DD-endopeptidase MepM/ murein hydrolase activator NlpD
MRGLLMIFAALVLVVILIGSGALNAFLTNTSNAMPASITQWSGLIEPIADQYKIDPALVAAVMLQESGGNPNARSLAGANGLMQVLGGPFEPRANIESGVSILARHLQVFKNLRVALAAYNAGPGLADADVAANLSQRFAGVRGAARQAGVSVGQFDQYVPYLPSETRRFVPTVMAIYERFNAGQLIVNSANGPGRYPLDQFTWRPTFGKNLGDGQDAHTGENLSVLCGTPVKASFNGELVHRGCIDERCRDGNTDNDATGHGLVIVQQFALNKFAVYAHLGSYVSDKSAQTGDVIGFVGTTGETRGCHLHYAIWSGTLTDLLKGSDKGWQDPKKYFPKS